ncbi:MAG: (d)CMP kinase [Elusimicrobia bacterium]|nr:(d)CMP kinase [Elusimicrobiota bacterium]
MTWKGKERRRRRWIIAMDGPAGVGKSTVGRLIAKKLGFLFLNTGEMYRALTWKVMREGIDPKNGKRIEQLARRIVWEFKPARGTSLRTFVDGVKINHQIRSEQVSRNASTVAGIPGVRKFMRKLQRKLGEKGGIVMEGRDITTNVFPDADFKLFLDASIDERAVRRYWQLKNQGYHVDLKTIRENIAARDKQDRERKINPLRQAPGSLVVDTTHLTLRQVANKILKCIHQRHYRVTD